MKRGIKIGLAVLMIVSVISVALIGCAKEEVPARVYDFTLAHQHPVTSLFTVQCEEWIDHMEAVSDGQLKFIHYPAETLVKGKEQHGALESGAIDAAYYIAVNFVGNEAINGICTTPLLFNGFEHSYAFMQDPVVRDIFVKRFRLHNMEWLGVGSICGVYAYSKDKPLANVEDWAGLATRAFSGLAGEWMNAAGASTMTMPSTEIYMAAERGMVEAWCTSLASQNAFGLYEVSKYFTDVMFVMPVNTMMFNLDAWNTLPDNLQKLLKDESFAIERSLMEEWRAAEDGLKQDLEAEGMIRVTLTAEQLAQWRALATPLLPGFSSALGEDGDTLLAKIEEHGLKHAD